MGIKKWPKNDRPREKLFKYGEVELKIDEQISLGIMICDAGYLESWLAWAGSPTLELP